MKDLVRCLRYASLIVGLAAAHAQVAPANPPFMINIRPVSANVAVGDDVWIQLTVKNMTNVPIDLNSTFDNVTNMDPNFAVEVTDDRGNAVPKRKFPVPPAGHPVSRTLDPGATMTEEEPVSRMFDMSKPGKYFIEASGPITGDTDVAIVRSNKISVTVSVGVRKNDQ